MSIIEFAPGAPMPVEMYDQPDTVADDLREAAHEIEEHGWARYALMTSEGALCTLGALAKVSGTLHCLITYGRPHAWDSRMYRYHRVARAFSHYLASHEMSVTGMIPGWNDNYPHLTADDVRVHLEKCAAEYEEVA